MVKTDVMIGVLALQGDYEKHLQMLQRLGCGGRLVYTAEDLQACDGLIVPGGESTTLILLMKKHGLWEPIRNFARRRPYFGTCAGCIVAARNVLGREQESLDLIDIAVERNAYGRQVDSFIDEVQIVLNGQYGVYEGVFIRAPKIRALGEGVQTLGKHGKDVVLAQQKHVLVATFHPELTDDPTIHQYFLDIVQRRKSVG